MDTTYLTEPIHQNVRLRQRLLAGSIVLTTVGALIYVRFYQPVAGGPGLYPSCPFYALTGFHCPGCGTLRGLHQLLNGHPIAALDLNPLMVLTLPFLAYVFVSQILIAVRGRGLRRIFVKPYLITAIFWVVLAFWVLRNIPVYPFTILAP